MASVSSAADPAMTEDKSQTANSSSTVETEEDPVSFIQYGALNYISRSAVIEDPHTVELKGKCVLKHGVQVANSGGGKVRMGRYCVIGENAVLKSAAAAGASAVSFTTTSTLQILRGHVIVGDNCTIEAAAIGTNVVVGSNSRLGRRCIIKDHCWIAPDSVLGDDTVIPPFSRVAGKPAQVVAELPPSAAVELQELTERAYQDFVDSKPKVS